LKPFFDAFPPLRRWLDEVQPDVAVVLYNDHGLNFFLDAMRRLRSVRLPSIAMKTKAGHPDIPAV